MRKEEAVRYFKLYVLPCVKDAYEQDGRRDAVARREAWNNFTDALCKDGTITPYQYDTWAQPRVCG